MYFFAQKFKSLWQIFANICTKAKIFQMTQLGRNENALVNNEITKKVIITMKLRHTKIRTYKCN